jgi:predicted nucleic acid-binding protein
VIVLDASVLIAHLNATDAHHERATELLLAARDEPFAASPLTLAEVLVGPARAGLLDRASIVLRQLGVTAVALDSDAPARLATLRAVTGLKLPDCCVLLAAEQTGASVLTFDDKLAAAARKRGLSAGQETSVERVTAGPGSVPADCCVTSGN